LHSQAAGRSAPAFDDTAWIAAGGCDVVADQAQVIQGAFISEVEIVQRSGARAADGDGRGINRIHQRLRNLQIARATREADGGGIVGGISLEINAARRAGGDGVVGDADGVSDEFDVACVRRTADDVGAGDYVNAVGAVAADAGQGDVAGARGGQRSARAGHVNAVIAGAGTCAASAGQRDVTGAGSDRRTGLQRDTIIIGGACIARAE